MVFSKLTRPRRQSERNVNNMPETKETKTNNTEKTINELIARIEALEAEKKAGTDEKKALTEAEAKEQAELEELVEVRLPRITANDSSVYLSINGKAITIKRGEKVSIPKKYVLLLEDMEAARDAEFDFQTQNAGKYKEIKQM